MARKGQSAREMRSLLDCSHPPVCMFWLAVGCMLAILFIRIGANSLGSWAGLLRVGVTNPMFAQINRDLGPFTTSEPLGHDGQLYYLIARDPLGLHGTPQALAAFEENGPRYRYRRILFPLLAGGFGYFGAHTTLAGMIVLAIAGMGLGAAALADLAFQWHLTPRVVLIALMNPGALISLWLLVADPLAMGLALVAIALAFRRQTVWALVACTLAALTKETYLLVAWSLSGWLWRQHRSRIGAAFAILPTLAVALWSAWLLARMPPGEAVVRNLGIPLQGIAAAIPIWITHERNPVEIVLAVSACLMVIVSVTCVTRSRLPAIRWLVTPWIVLAMIATVRVWGPPNNAARTLAVLWPFSVFLVASRQTPGHPQPSSHST
jgi:hypothetical protein